VIKLLSVATCVNFITSDPDTRI